MKKVQRTTPRRLTGWQKLLLLALVVGLAALAFFLLRDSKPVVPAPPAASVPVELFRAEEADLQQIRVKPRGEPPYALVRQGDGFQVEGQPAFQLDREETAALASSLAYVEAVYTLADTEKEQLHLHDFGLEGDALQIEATYKNGDMLRLRIGDRIPGDEALDYCLIGDDPKLYAIHADRKEMFNLPLRMLHALPGINFTPDLLDSVQFDGADTALSLHRLATDMWVIQQPFLYPAADAAVQQLLEGAGNMRFASYVAPADSENSALYGLEVPRIRVVFRLGASVVQTMDSTGQTTSSKSVAEQAIAIDIGNPIDNIGFYCRYGDSIWQASNASMGFLLKNQAQDYASRYPLGIPLSLVSRWTLSTTEEEYAYQVFLVEHVLDNNEIAVDENQSPLYNIVLEENGVEIDAALALQQYAALMQIRAVGDYQGDQKEPAGAPLLSVGLSYLGQEIAVTFHPMDALYASIWINGRCLHYTELAQLQRVLQPDPPSATAG